MAHFRNKQTNKQMYIQPKRFSNLFDLNVFLEDYTSDLAFNFFRINLLNEGNSKTRYICGHLKCKINKNCINIKKQFQKIKIYSTTASIQCIKKFIADFSDNKIYEFCNIVECIHTFIQFLMLIGFHKKQQQKYSISFKFR